MPGAASGDSFLSPAGQKPLQGTNQPTPWARATPPHSLEQPVSKRTDSLSCGVTPASLSSCRGALRGTVRG